MRNAAAWEMLDKHSDIYIKEEKREYDIGYISSRESSGKHAPCSLLTSLTWIRQNQACATAQQ